MNAGVDENRHLRGQATERGPGKGLLGPERLEVDGEADLASPVHLVGLAVELGELDFGGGGGVGDGDVELDLELVAGRLWTYQQVPDQRVPSGLAAEMRNQSLGGTCSWWCRRSGRDTPPQPLRPRRSIPRPRPRRQQRDLRQHRLRVSLLVAVAVAVAEPKKLDLRTFASSLSQARKEARACVNSASEARTSRVNRYEIRTGKPDMDWLTIKQAAVMWIYFRSDPIRPDMDWVALRHAPRH
ncbi:hypothetical protein BHE74_00021819 [Ensete ventricosum]|nr:hypothetical protein BHE74_00021819 [Ensete ventricosum]